MEGAHHERGWEIDPLSKGLEVLLEREFRDRPSRQPRSLSVLFATSDTRATLVNTQVARGPLPGTGPGCDRSV